MRGSGGCQGAHSTSNLDFGAIIGATDWDEEGLATRNDQVLRQCCMVAESMLISTGDISNDGRLCGGIETGWELLRGQSGLNDSMGSNRLDHF